MDFNAKRLGLLAGVGDHEDRHEIVQEQVQQLNESAEERQMTEDEDQVRKAVRRTIQKMISEGVISLQEDSIERELEHLRKNIAADHDHIADLLDDIRADRDEEHRAEHHRDEMHDMDEAHHEEVEESVEDRLARNLKSKGEWEKDMLSKSSDDGYHDMELDDPDLDDAGLAEEKLEEALNENDVALRRLQMLAGVQILTEGYADEEAPELQAEVHDMDERRKVDGAPAFAGPGQIAAMDATEDPETGADQVQEDEAKLYEMEDGTHEMEMDGKRYSLVPLMEEDLDEEKLAGTMDTESGTFDPDPIDTK